MNMKNQATFQRRTGNEIFFGIIKPRCEVKKKGNWQKILPKSIIYLHIHN